MEKQEQVKATVVKRRDKLIRLTVQIEGTKRPVKVVSDRQYFVGQRLTLVGLGSHWRVKK